MKGRDRFLVIVTRDFKNSMELTVRHDPTVMKVLKDGSIVPADAYMDTMEVDPGDVAIYIWTNNK